MLQQVNQLEALKSAAGVFKATSINHMLSHMATCISIALPAQCRVYPIFQDGIYDGSVILGSAWCVGYKGQMTMPVSHDHLLQAMHTAASHHGSMRIIEGILGIAEGMITEDTIPDKITSMWDLHTRCMDSQLTEADKSKIMRNAINLRFEATRFKIHVESFEKLFNLISGKIEFDETCPINPFSLFSDDRIELALSCFGFEAPSFLIDNGTIAKVSSTLRAPPHISVKQVPIPRAVIDLKSVRASKEIRYAAPRLSAAFKYRQFSSSAEKEKIWGFLGEFTGIEVAPFENVPRVVAANLDDW